MQGTSFISKPKLVESIEATRTRITRLRYKMKAKRDELVLVDISNAGDKLDEYQKMNEEMRRAKIYEAELTYLKNML